MADGTAVEPGNRGLRPLSAERETISMSKLGFDSGTTLCIAHAGRSATFTASPWLPFGLRAMSLPTLSGWVPAHVARFPPASARFAYSRALIGGLQNSGSLDRLSGLADPLLGSMADVVQQTGHLPSGPPKRAKPAAEREVKGKASLLAEPRADRTVGPIPAKPVGA